MLQLNQFALPVVLAGQVAQSVLQDVEGYANPSNLRFRSVVVCFLRQDASPAANSFAAGPQAGECRVAHCTPTAQVESLTASRTGETESI